MRQRVWCAAALLALMLAACGAKDRKLPVSGSVTWRGKPLETGMIRFLPQGEGPKTESGAVIIEGRYSIPRESGLEPGTYKVTVSSPDPKSGTIPDAPPGERGGYPATERVPAEYNVKTRLTFEVKAGATNQFDVTIP